MPTHVCGRAISVTALLCRNKGNPMQASASRRERPPPRNDSGDHALCRRPDIPAMAAIELTPPANHPTQNKP